MLLKLARHPAILPMPSSWVHTVASTWKARHTSGSLATLAVHGPVTALAFGAAARHAARSVQLGMKPIARHRLAPSATTVSCGSLNAEQLAACGLAFVFKG
jgi:hypothetical protein